MTDASLDTLLAYARTDDAAYDLDVWKACFRMLHPRSPKRAAVVTSIEHIDRELRSNAALRRCAEIRATSVQRGPLIPLGERPTRVAVYRHRSDTDVDRISMAIYAQPGTPHAKFAPPWGKTSARQRTDILDKIADVIVANLEALATAET